MESRTVLSGVEMFSTATPTAANLIHLINGVVSFFSLFAEKHNRKSIYCLNAMTI